ncbi:hypothetical protein PF006_g23369 [Phytophthora fragariae]|uniref:Uncharacterized protein n=1 Tax=Phytophthora fragariae TaxID=53985 RepID=A0A6A3RJ21_9STRA|nr:hypothetical protein PF006_g23369 [Phytophthora fragariae]KAE9187126.1 hypothetical protein PF004_g22891 [Phytophthora fragariae]
MGSGAILSRKGTRQVISEEDFGQGKLSQAIAVDFRSRKKLPRASMVVLASCLVRDGTTPSPFRFLGGLDSPTTAGSSTFFAGMDVRHRRGHEEIDSVDLPPARKAALELRKVSSNDVFYMDEAVSLQGIAYIEHMFGIGPCSQEEEGPHANCSGGEQLRHRENPATLPGQAQKAQKQ